MTIGNESDETQEEYLKMAGSYAIPIFWVDNNNVANNGTAFILDTGERTFVVTAAHVFKDYIEAKTNVGIISCQLSNIEFELEERLISCVGPKTMDIATFSITEKEIKRINKSVLRGSQKMWPPAQPNEGESVIVAGFPGVERIGKDDHEFSFGLVCFNTPVSSVSDRHFGCLFEREYWIDTFGNGFPEELYNLGGISGAPVIALEKSVGNIVTWRLAGVVYEANASEMMGEISFVHHSRFISTDGTIVGYT
jgi:hypothetical protein